MAESNIHLQAVRRHWWVVLLIPPLAVGSAAFFTSKQTPVYRAVTTTVITPVYAMQGGDNIMRSLETLERRTVVATFANIPSLRETRDTTAIQLGLAPQELRGYRINASVVPSTNMIRIAAEGPDRRRVAEVANAAAQVTENEARRMYRIFAMKTLEAAVPASRPIYPNPVRNYFVSGILGLFLGLALAVAIEFLSTLRRSRPRVSVE